MKSKLKVPGAQCLPGHLSAVWHLLSPTIRQMSICVERRADLIRWLKSAASLEPTFRGLSHRRKDSQWAEQVFSHKPSGEFL